MTTTTASILCAICNQNHEGAGLISCIHYLAGREQGLDLTTVAEHIDLVQLAKHLDTDAIISGAAENVDLDAVAAAINLSDLDLSSLAGEVSLSDLAREFSDSDIASEIDLSSLANEIDLAGLGAEISVTDLEIDTAEVAGHLDIDEVAAAIDMDRLARAVEDRSGPGNADLLERMAEQNAEMARMAADIEALRSIIGAFRTPEGIKAKPGSDSAGDIEDGDDAIPEAAAEAATPVTCVAVNRHGYRCMQPAGHLGDCTFAT